LYSESDDPESEPLFRERTLLDLVNSTGLFATSTKNSTGNSGTTNIRVGGILSLKNNSLIKAEALGGASGGNILIKAGFILAYPSQKPNDGNDIIANADAEFGKGGNISISTERLFGIGIRSATPGNGTNDISAASQSSDPIEFYFVATEPKLPSQFTEPDKTVAQACDGGGDIADQNTFTITGRGGMPEDPTKPLNSVAIAGNLKSGRDPMQKGKGTEEQRSGGAEEKKTLSSDEIIPARGVAYNEKGQVVLTRYSTKYGSDRPLVQSDYCSTSLQQEKLVATEQESDSLRDSYASRAEETLSDRTVEELMDFLYSLNPEQKK
jgi:hypothetical protein